MTLTRNDLVGKHVYNPDASLVGEIKDVGLSIDSRDPTLIVKINDSLSIELPWTDVASAKDIVLTKAIVNISNYKEIVTTPPLAVVQPQQQAPMAQTPQAMQGHGTRFCTTCGKKASWIDKYSRWYCYNCKKYL